MSFNWRRTLWVLFGLLTAGAAQAGCSPKFDITFPDGGKGCFEDYAFSQRRAPSTFTSLARNIPQNGRYVLAMPRHPAMCPAALGYDPYSVASSFSSTMPDSERMLRVARSCQSDAGDAGAASGGPCECTAVLIDGRSLVTRAEFEDRANGAAAPATLALEETWRRSVPAARPAVAVGPVPAAAAEAGPEPFDKSCPTRFTVALADGSRTCFISHGIAERRAAGLFVSLAKAVPPSGNFSVAVPAPAGRCPAVYGWSSSSGNGTLSLPESRDRRALDVCASELRESHAAADCQCVLLTSDGQSSHGRQAFAALARLSEAPGTAQAATPQVAVAPAAGPPSQSLPERAALPAASKPASALGTTVIPAPAPPTSFVVAPVGPTSAELSALREQLQALQSQMSRQQAAVAQAPVAAPQPRAKLRARALIIGNGKYANLGTLPNPPNDARAMAAKLKQFGIEVDLVLDADRAALVRALSDYQARAAGYDVNVLFYAGHGLQVDGINYVVPVEMVAAGVTAGSVKLNAVSLNDALEYLPARTRLVFLDACRDNPLSRSLRASRSSASAGLAPVNATSGTLVAYATRDGSTAEDGRGGNSPYTAALLQHLDADEDIAIVLRRVRQAVLASTDKRQEPWEYGSLVGDQLVLSKLAR